MSFFALQKSRFLPPNPPAAANMGGIWGLTKLVLSTIEN
jgi:hypothetical protein